MRVSSETKRQSTELLYDALLLTGVAARHLFKDYAYRAKDDRPGLA